MASGPLYGAGYVELQPKLAASFGPQLNQQVSAVAAGVGKAFIGLQIGQAIVGGLSAAVGSALSFESAFAGVTKTVEGTEAQIGELREGIIDMARELPATREEIAGIAEAAGQLGIETDAILGFTKVMVDLGETTNLSSEQAADSLARLANITQLPQDKFENLGSTIVDLGNKSAATESEIVDLGLRLAGAGNQVGLAETDILGIAAALSSVGIEAEAGGSAFSRVMVELANAVAGGGEDLQAFAEVAGETAQGFATHFKTDAADAIVSFVEGLGEINTAGGNVFPILEQLGLDQIRVQDALLRSAGAGDLLRESIQQGSEAWQENNALTKEAEKRYATSEAQFEVMQNRLSEVGMELGEDLLPSLLSLGESFLGIVEAAEPLLGVLGDVALGVEMIVDQFGEGLNALDPAFQSVSEHVAGLRNDVQAGLDPATSLANRIADMGRQGNLAAGDLERLQREAGLTGTRMADIAVEFLNAAEAGSDVGLSTQEIIELFGEFPGVMDKVIASVDPADRKFFDASQTAFLLSDGMAAVGTEAGQTDLGGFTEELSGVEQAFFDAAQDGQSLRTVIQELADPVFAAVDSFKNYKDALREAREDGKITFQEKLGLGDVALQVASDFALAGENIGESLESIAAATGLTKDEVIAGLEEMGLTVDEEAGTLGAAIVDGIVNEVDTLAERLSGTLIDEIASSVQVAQKYMKVASPSKLFAEELGLPMGQGVVLGASQGLSELPDTFTGSFADTQSAALKAMGNRKPVSLFPAGRVARLEEVAAAGPGGGFHVEGDVIVNNPTGEPTEESLQAVPLAVSVAGFLRR